jgi:hypothetical protein
MEENKNNLPHVFALDMLVLAARVSENEAVTAKKKKVVTSRGIIMMK